MFSKVLYVSPIWTNLKQFILSDRFESGMPAFSEPLRYLFKQGVEVKILWIREKSSPDLRDHFLSSQAYINIKTNSKLGLISSFFIVFLHSIRNIIVVKPDVVVCHGAASVGAIMAAYVLRKRAIVRVYGTNKYAGELERMGSFWFFLKYPFVHMMFSLPSSAVIATDDGSGADRMFRRIGRSSEFHFLKNGLPSVAAGFEASSNNLLCIGRIEAKKNQLLALEFFNLVAAENPDLCLKFIGEVSSPEYFFQMCQAIDVSPFSDRIEVLDAVDKHELSEYYSSCEAVLSFQDISNFGNVVIESFAFGCLVISFAEPLFDDLARHIGGRVAVLCDGVQESAEYYSALSLDDKNLIRENGRMAINKALGSWEDRSEIEYKILKRNGDE